MSWSSIALLPLGIKKSITWCQKKGYGTAYLIWPLSLLFSLKDVLCASSRLSTDWSTRVLKKTMLKSTSALRPGEEKVAAVGRGQLILLVSCSNPVCNVICCLAGSTMVGNTAYNSESVHLSKSRIAMGTARNRLKIRSNTGGFGGRRTQCLA